MSGVEKEEGKYLLSFSMYLQSIRMVYSRGRAARFLYVWIRDAFAYVSAEKAMTTSTDHDEHRKVSGAALNNAV